QARRARPGWGDALNNLGIHHYAEGRWGEAVECYRASREAKLRAGDLLGAAVQENNVGEVLSDQGRLAEAEALFRNMVRASRAARFPIGAALGTSNLAGSFVNSIIITVPAVIIPILLALLAAYAFARFAFPGRV
ncbi:MAG: tetratricopeptide repeat protein, partial [Bacteroidales bacterium]